LLLLSNLASVSSSRLEWDFHFHLTFNFWLSEAHYMMVNNDLVDQLMTTTSIWYFLQNVPPFLQLFSHWFTSQIPCLYKTPYEPKNLWIFSTPKFLWVLLNSRSLLSRFVSPFEVKIPSNLKFTGSSWTQVLVLEVMQNLDSS